MSAHALQALDSRRQLSSGLRFLVTEWLKRYFTLGWEVHGAPGHPQTQGKIERWHQTLKNRILPENYFFQEDLEAQIAAFVEHSIIVDTTRVSTISRRPTSTSHADRPYCSNVKGSNETQSDSVA
jgi:transposase InsO family protein